MNNKNPSTLEFRNTLNLKPIKEMIQSAEGGNNKNQNPQANQNKK